MPDLVEVHEAEISHDDSGQAPYCLALSRNDCGQPSCGKLREHPQRGIEHGHRQGERVDARVDPHAGRLCVGRPEEDQDLRQDEEADHPDDDPRYHGNCGARYTDVDVGTLYYAIRQLEKDGLIATVSRERVARGGMRTIYRITPKGKAEFRDLLHRQFEEEGLVSQTLYGALLFLHFSDLAVVEDLLRRRIARLDELIAKLDPIRKELRPVMSTGAEHLLRHLEKQRRLDRDWLKGLLADVAAHRVHDVTDPKRLTDSDRTRRSSTRR